MTTVSHRRDDISDDVWRGFVREGIDCDESKEQVE